MKSAIIFLVLFLFSDEVLRAQVVKTVALYLYPENSRVSSIENQLSEWFKRDRRYLFKGRGSEGNPDYRIILEESEEDEEYPVLKVLVLSKRLVARQTFVSLRPWERNQQERWMYIAAETFGHLRHWFQNGPPKALPLRNSNPKTSSMTRARSVSPLGVDVVGYRKEVGRSDQPFDPLDLNLSPQDLWEQAESKPEKREKNWNLLTQLEGGSDSNPSQTNNGSGGDAYLKTTLSGTWTPVPTHRLGYTLMSRNYIDQTDLNLLAHLVNYGHRRELEEMELGFQLKGLALSLDQDHTLMQWGAKGQLKVNLGHGLKMLLNSNWEQSHYEESLSGLDGDQIGADIGLEVGVKDSTTLSGGLGFSQHNADNLEFEKWKTWFKATTQSSFGDWKFSHRLSLEFGERDDDTLTLGQARRDQFYAAKYQVSHDLKRVKGLRLNAGFQIKEVDSNISNVDISRNVISLSALKVW